MRVLHTYCLNYNLGDYALGIGVKNLLRAFMPIDYIGETNIQGREFNEYYINEVVNKRYDLLVIGGGGLIHGSHWPNGWFWLIDKHLISTIKIPYIVYGVGDNYFENEDIPERAITHLAETYKYAKYFSVRNDGSFERVSKFLPFTPEEVPDPGFFTAYQSETAIERIIPSEYIVIQIANDKSSERFKTVENKTKFVEELRKVVTYLSKKYHVVFLPHVYDDIKISTEIIEGISNCTIVDFSIIAFDKSYKVLSYYKYAKFVLAMRGHGQIIPISYNIPTIALCNHPKHSGLMKKLGLDDYIEYIDTNFSSSKLISKIELIENNYIHCRELLLEVNTDLERKTLTAFQKINKVLKLSNS